MAGMNCGARSYGKASLMVAIPTSLPGRMQGRVREIVGVYVPEAHRRQGLATELLTRTAREASRKGAVLMLTLDDDALEAFYGRFGFIRVQRDPILMVRP